jgi:hypothetical protein
MSHRNPNTDQGDFMPIKSRNRQYWWFWFRASTIVAMILLGIIVVVGIHIGPNYAPELMPRFIWWQNYVVLPVMHLACLAALAALHKMMKAPAS